MFSSTNSLSTSKFESLLQAAVAEVKHTLHETEVAIAPNVPHQYEDKYELAAILVRIGCSAAKRVLLDLGIDTKTFSAIAAQRSSRAILRLNITEHCTFSKKYVEKTKGNTVTTKGFFGKRTSVVVTKVEKYSWLFRVDVAFTLELEEAGQTLPLVSYSCEKQIVTLSEQAPRPRTKVRPGSSLDMSWFCAHYRGVETHENGGEEDEEAFRFSIRRGHPCCKTPRRNADVEACLVWCNRVAAWSSAVRTTLRELIGNPGWNQLQDILYQNPPLLPHLPLFRTDSKAKTGSLILVPEQIAQLLAQYDQQLHSATEKLVQVVQENKEDDEYTMLTAPMGVVALATTQLHVVVEFLWAGLQFIETMMVRQLQAGVGKHLTQLDFDEYMVYHNRKLFATTYRPKPFSYALRTPGRAPVGVVSIYTHTDKQEAQPIRTQVYTNPACQPEMFFKINASTKVRFHGVHYVHSWLTHQFQETSKARYSLNARSRQFSAFIVVLGTVTSGKEFTPNHSFMCRNKDEYSIPLEVTALPTAHEFESALESMSPEQVRFAQAYRAMQLGTSVFGVCLIPLIPQLEAVLLLPSGSLLKERRLVENLLDLFIDYQLSSDLFKYRGAPEEKESTQAQVEKVRQHVAAVLLELKAQEKCDVNEAKMKAVVGLTTLNSVKSGGDEGLRKQLFAKKRHNAKTHTATTQFAHNGVVIDYTTVPGMLDEHFLVLDKTNALRSCSVTLGTQWTKMHQKTTISKQLTTHLSSAQQKESAMDLVKDVLDALSRSGDLRLEQCEFHILLPVSHCFTQSVVDTVIAGNTNPIEVVERSSLLLAILTQRKPLSELLCSQEQLARVAADHPDLAALC